MVRLKEGLGGECYIFEKGSLEDKNDRTGRWDSADGRTYIVCPQCNKINAIQDKSLNGFWFNRTQIYRALDACVLCRWCGNHVFIMLGGGGFKLNEEEKKIIRTIRRGLESRKWYGRISYSTVGTMVYIRPAAVGDNERYVMVREIADRDSKNFGSFCVLDSNLVDSKDFFVEQIAAIRRMVEVLRG